VPLKSEKPDDDLSGKKSAKKEESVNFDQAANPESGEQAKFET